TPAATPAAATPAATGHPQPPPPPRTPTFRPGRPTAARRLPPVAMAPRPEPPPLTPAPEPLLAAATRAGGSARSTAMIPRPEMIADVLLRIFITPLTFLVVFTVISQQCDRTGKVPMFRHTPGCDGLAPRP